MARTYRLINYRKGKPVYGRHCNKQFPYRFWTHEHKIVRKKLWRAYRRKCKIFLKKGWSVPVWRNTCGWETW